MANQIKTKEQVFESYKILDQHLGGTTATIYEVEDKEGDKYCVKIYKSDKAEIFPGDIDIKESHLVKHDIPFLVKVYEVDRYVEKGRMVHYSIMEYVNGIALDEYIGSQEYDSSFIENLADRLRKTNDLLLKKNIAHRDIKTSNIVVNENGDGVLVDLGLLSRIDSENLTKKEKSFLDEELNEVYGTSMPLTREQLPKYWKVVTLFQIGRVINDTIVRKSRIKFKDIRVYLSIEYEIRLLCNNNKKIIASIATIKHLLKLIRRIRLKMAYFK